MNWFCQQKLSYLPKQLSNPLSKIALVVSLLAIDSLHAATLPVTSYADDGSSETLRYAMSNYEPGDTIDLTAIANQTITLTSSLPILGQTCSIINTADSAVTISGNTQYQIFTVRAEFSEPVVSISNLNLTQGKAQGGTGASGRVSSYQGGGQDSGQGGAAGAGGGGLGAGGALFVDSGTTVVLNQVTLASNTAVGGAGGSISSSLYNYGVSFSSGQGGELNNNPFDLGFFHAYAYPNGAYLNNAGVAGNYGYGGGGAGGNYDESGPLPGGVGGFGAGGGGGGGQDGNEDVPSGAGGLSGQYGGAGVAGTGAKGNVGDYILGGNGGPGGGGAALGGAIFVQNGGQLTLTDVTFAIDVQSNGVTAGTAGAGLDVGGGSYSGNAGQAIGPDLFADEGATVTFTSQAGSSFPTGMAGASTFTKTSSGVLNITSDHPDFTGVIDISVDEVKLNALVGGDISLTGANAVLSGVGHIGGNLLVYNGTLAPGNSIGTMTIVGTMYQADKTYYNVQIQGGLTPNCTLSNVTGGTSPALIDSGATIQLSSIDGTLNLGTPYTIVSAPGGIFGTYGAVEMPSEVLIATQAIVNNDLQLTLTRSFPLGAQNGNQYAMANQLGLLDAGSPTTAQALLLSDLTWLPVNALQMSYNQLTGISYSNLLISSESATNRFGRELYSNLRPIATASASADKFQPTTWLETSYFGSHCKNAKEGDSFSSNGYQLVLGAQSAVTSELTAGAALSYELEEIKDHLESKTKTHRGLAGLYGLYRPEIVDGGYYVQGNLIVGADKSDLSRQVEVASSLYKVSSKPRSTQVALYGEFGYDYRVRETLVQPFAGLLAGRYSHSFSDENSGQVTDLSLTKRAHNVLSTRLGAHLSRTVSPEQVEGVLDFGLDLAWQHRLTTVRNELNVSFVQFGESFTIEGIGYDRDSLEGVFSMSKQFDSVWRANLDARLEKGQHSLNYGFAITLEACL